VQHCRVPNEFVLSVPPRQCGAVLTVRLGCRDRYLRIFETSTGRDVPLLSIRRSSTGYGAGALRSLMYNSAENCVLVCSDVDGGTYELYQALPARPPARPPACPLALRSMATVSCASPYQLARLTRAALGGTRVHSKAKQTNKQTNPPNVVLVCARD
jgi:hypothetical protein